MASNSQKKTATSNTTKLAQLHAIGAAINVVALLAVLVLKRPSGIKPLLFLSVPSIYCQYVIEKSGRPVYAFDAVNGYNKLVKGGQDLNQPGLFEYMFDVIYVTWILDILMVVVGSNKVWYLYTVIPGFAVYKLSSIVMPFFKKSPQAKEPAQQQQQPETSKRQQKREKKQQKPKFVR